MFFIFFLLLCLTGSSSSDETVVSTELGVLFDSNIHYTVTSNFGYRSSPLNTKKELHSGIDLAIPQGTEIRASASGTVVWYKVTTGTGDSVMLEHDIGGIKYRTVYYLMLSNSVVVNTGDKVNAGQKIGIVGMTGTQVTGVHLHFEVRVYNAGTNNYDYVDPKYIFEK